MQQSDVRCELKYATGIDELKLTLKHSFIRLQATSKEILYAMKDWLTHEKRLYDCLRLGWWEEKKLEGGKSYD